MHPHHRAQLAAAIARFLDDIRRLAREARPRERDRLLTALEPKGARSAAAAPAGASGRAAAAATRRQPAARTRQAAAGAGARQATRRARKPDAAANPHAAAAAAESPSTTAAIAAETRTAPVTPVTPVTMDRPATEAATSAIGPAAQAAGAPEDQARSERQESASSTEPTATPGPAARGAAPAGTASGQSGGKRVQWTRESIIDELARWMVTGTALDASFVKRNGPPGLVPAAIRIFGRFDAALNVAGLHVAKLYPAGPPASDGVDARRPRRSPGRRWSSTSGTRA